VKIVTLYSLYACSFQLAPHVHLSREKVAVDKPCVTLVGTSASSTVITWNESWVAAESPTVSVLAPDFIAKRLTFQVLIYDRPDDATFLHF
jgi:hypothetical protein